MQDHLGSTTWLSNERGQSQKRLEYTAYGKLDGREDNPTLKNPFTYTGREDDGTGLMYYRARYYDPEIEVFISEDPLGDAQRYVGGNPLKFVDPMGLLRSVGLIKSPTGIGVHVDVISNTGGMYGAWPGSNNAPGSYTGTGSIDTYQPPAGHQYTEYYLDPAIFGDDDILYENTASKGWWLEHCSSYTARVLNEYLKKAGKPTLGAGILPDALISELILRGYITGSKTYK